MKKLFILFAALCTGAAAYAQHADEKYPKLSPVTRMLLRDAGKLPAGAIPPGYVYRTVKGRNYFTGVVKVADMPAAETKFVSLGVIVNTKAGNIWTVQVPAEKLKAFTQTTGISYIQLDEPLRPTLDSARSATHVDSVHKGIGLAWPFTGADVIMGIIDFGFDYGHPTLFDTSGNNYRVKKVWELNTTGTPPAGYSYGHEIAGAAAIQAQGTDNAQQTHGTGVAGIAAGSGYGSANGKLRGMAFGSDMVFVGVRRDSIADQWRQGSFSDFIDGVNYIFQYANGQRKPAVVNISWGSQSGPHDGTSLFNQACDNLSGPGKIIVMSAGNEGEEHIHLSKTFTPTDTLINTFVTFSADNYKRTWVDIWGDTGKTFCAQVTLYKNGVAGNTTGYICIDDQLHSTYLIGDNGLDTCFVDFITSSAEFNDKPRMTLNIFNKAADSIHVSVKATDGAIDMWDEYYYYGYTYGYSSIFESLGMPGAVNGNNISTVSDMGSAKSVLLVGAYASKTKYTDINNNTWYYSSYVSRGNIVPFSSRGPMVDGRIKPDITAPGLTLATAISSFDTRYTPTGLNKQSVVSSFTSPANGKTYYFAEFSGTSASSPAAAGIVALMLQANPHLDPQQVHDIIAQTAIRDNYTGNLPAAGNNTWGHGKINAYAAVRASWQANNVYDVASAKLNCALFPNPGTGSYTLSYIGTRSEKLDIQVTDIKGAIILAEKWNVTQGENIRTINITDLPSGTYLVQVASGQGRVTMKAQKL